MTARRLTSLLLAAFAALAILAPATSAASVQNRARAFPLAAHTHTGGSTVESPWTRPGSAADPARTAAGCCVAAKGASGVADHVVFGKSIGLSERASQIGGRHLMGSADWQADVAAAIGNPKTKISVALDDLEGAGPAYSRVMSAVQRNASGRGSPLDWELAQLQQAGRLSTTKFYEGGNAVANPFR